MKLKELMGEDWFNKLSPFLKSEEFKEIAIKLKSELDLINSVLIPSIDNVFNAFKLCRYSDLKVVILNDIPYKDLKVNDGLAFSVNDFGMTLTRDHKVFCEGIETDIYEGMNLKTDYKLDRLAEQGVLLLNTTLTMSFAEDVWERHTEMWQPFIKYAITEIVKENTGIVFILVGRNVREYADIILQSQNYLLTCTHPREATHFAQTWDAGGVFEITNKILKQNNNLTINW